MLTVISYDIVEDRTRKRFSNFLLDYAHRVQYSVFECRQGADVIGKIRQQAENEIDHKTDSVIFYQICKGCAPKRKAIGLDAGRSEDFLVI